MAVGQDEAVAVGPGGFGGVVAHDPREKDVRQRRQRHGRARVARIGLLGGVHGQAAHDIDPELFELRFGHPENRTRSGGPPTRSSTSCAGRCSRDLGRVVALAAITCVAGIEARTRP